MQDLLSQKMLQGVQMYVCTEDRHLLIEFIMQHAGHAGWGNVSLCVSVCRGAEWAVCSSEGGG